MFVLWVVCVFVLFCLCVVCAVSSPRAVLVGYSTQGVAIWCQSWKSSYDHQYPPRSDMASVSNFFKIGNLGFAPVLLELFQGLCRFFKNAFLKRPSLAVIHGTKSWGGCPVTECCAILRVEFESFVIIRCVGIVVTRKTTICAVVQMYIHFIWSGFRCGCWVPPFHEDYVLSDLLLLRILFLCVCCGITVRSISNSIPFK